MHRLTNMKLQKNFIICIFFNIKSSDLSISSVSSRMHSEDVHRLFSEEVYRFPQQRDAEYQLKQ